MKSAGYGSPVEWHQDWAFYPHTNDDLAAVGIMLDDCDMENGPMMVLPGSHNGPIYDHHARTAASAARWTRPHCDIDFSQARAAASARPARSPSITCAPVHGSATNLSDRQRRLLLYQYRAADAWPLLGLEEGFDKFNEQLVVGEPTLEPRIAPVPVRMPLPPAEHQGSIYENQRASGRRYFETAPATRVAAE